MDSNHCQIVQKSLSGERAVDEQTFASLAVLNERMERLKERGMDFSNVRFSDVAKKLAKQENSIAVS